MDNTSSNWNVGFNGTLESNQFNLVLPSGVNYFILILNNNEPISNWYILLCESAYV